MMRGEKRPPPPDSACTLVNGHSGHGHNGVNGHNGHGHGHGSNGVVSNGGGGGAGTALPEGAPLEKKPREKMRDFDWSADNYALTWRLVEELRKPENKSVLFPDKNMAVKTGDTKEDVYRRIAKAIHPEAYTTDAHVAGSRMKNKNVSMWKEFSGYYRRLQELCETHQVPVPAANGPPDNCPTEIHAEWRKIIVSMPVFPALTTFMPIRPEEKAKAPTVRSTPRVSTNGTYTHSPHTPLKDEQILDRERDSRIPISYSGPATSPSVHQASVLHDISNGTMEGHLQTNSVDLPINKKHKSTNSVQEYLELRRSYQEDVRLGIFTAAEAKQHIEALDKQRTQLESSRTNGISPIAHSPASTASTYGHSTMSQTPTASSMAPDPMTEHVYEDKILQLGFRKPVTSSNPLSRMSYKELFKTILDHAAECDLQECRLDTRRKTARLAFVPAPHSPEFGNMPVDIMIATRAGFVPLSMHASAACAQVNSRHTVMIMDTPLAVHSSASWDTTIWDHAYAVVIASFRNQLTIEEIKTAQASAQSLIADPNFRHQLQLVNENSTFFDLLRLGLLCGMNWSPGNAAMTPHEGIDQQQVNHH